MNWFYAEGQQQKGPVSEADLDNLVRSGVVRDDTLVWREGMAGWQPYGQVKGTVASPVAPAAPPADGVVCHSCGRLFSRDEVIRYGELWVCAGCKPGFLQRLREGADLTGAPGQMATEEQVLARDYSVTVGDYLSQAWELFKNNAGIMIGATVLVYLALMAVNVIPYLSTILALVFTGPLMGGLWSFYIRKARGEEAGIREAFGGFGPRFGQLLLAHVVPGILAGLCILPVVLIVILGAVMTASAGRSGGDSGALNAGLIILGVVLGAVGFAGMIYLSVSWLFCLPLVADKGLNFWPAMSLSRRVVGKHWWGTLWLMIVVGLICMLGLIACGVGLLVAGPVSFAAIALHYRKVFGDLAPVFG